MTKTPTLEEILREMKVEEYGLVSREDTAQRILQWVADEVVGKTVYGKNGSPINHTLANHRDKQRQILKDHGWKLSDKGYS